MNFVFMHMNRLVSMPAENTISALLVRIVHRTGRNFRRHAQPARIEPVNQPDDGLVLEIHLLQGEIERCPKLAQAHVIHLKAIELVPVDRHVTQAAIVPRVILINAHPDQVRHDIGEPVVVIAFHPNDFDAALRVRELANVAEKLPMIFGEAGKVEVGENVAQQNQPPKTVFLQHARGFAGMARLCTEVQVGKDQRVVHGQIHSSVIALECYGPVKCASKLVQWYRAGNPQ